jgi:hypothetical protein
VTGGTTPARPGRRRLVLTAAALLAVLALTGCRGGLTRGAGTGAGGSADGATPVATQQSGAAGSGSGSGSAAGGSGGSASGDLGAVDQDLAGLSSVDGAVGSDLGAAVSEGAQPDNG